MDLQAQQAIRHYGQPKRWLMNPSLREQLPVQHHKGRMQSFCGIPIKWDLNEPLQVNMEVLTLRSLWDQLP